MITPASLPKAQELRHLSPDPETPPEAVCVRRLRSGRCNTNAPEAGNQPISPDGAELMLMQ
jgi:hypothetical protein